MPTAARHHVPIPDGGGLSSTADWSIPREDSDLLGALREKFKTVCLEWNVVQCLISHCRDGSSDPLFTDSESTLKSELGLPAQQVPAGFRAC